MLHTSIVLIRKNALRPKAGTKGEGCAFRGTTRLPALGPKKGRTGTPTAGNGAGPSPLTGSCRGGRRFCGAAPKGTSPDGPREPLTAGGGPSLDAAWFGLLAYSLRFWISGRYDSTVWRKKQGGRGRILDFGGPGLPSHRGGSAEKWSRFLPKTACIWRIKSWVYSGR